MRLRGQGGQTTREKSKEKFVICVCGLTGCGKSTLAKRLAIKYGLKYLSGGDAMRALATEMGYNPGERSWWVDDEGRKFLQQRNGDHEFDRKIDDKLIEWAKQGNVVLDSWTMPWLLKDGFKIWLEASTKERARRIAKRAEIGFRKVLDIVKEKDGKNKLIYEKHYGFSLGEDLSPFSLILDTNKLSVDEAFRVLCMVIDSFGAKKET